MPLATDHGTSPVPAATDTAAPIAIPTANGLKGRNNPRRKGLGFCQAELRVALAGLARFPLALRWLVYLPVFIVFIVLNAACLGAGVDA